MHILLFDLDGVLIEPRAYHLALQETVSMVGRALGYREVALDRGDIRDFESVGVTSEWDSAAICAALLLRRAWSASEDYSLPNELPLPKPPPHELPAPNFPEFFESIRSATSANTTPLLLAERQLLSDGRLLTRAQASALRMCLRGARRAEDSVTFRLFQELVLGSELFSQIYRVPPHLNSKGYLQSQDRPLLSGSARRELKSWLMQPGHHAAVFTKRPSRPPDGPPYAPEAELALEVAGLEQLPVVGLGDIAWLAASRGEDRDTFLKPSAIHALSALRLATGSSIEEALQAAADLELDGRADNRWQSLSGARISIFEDSAEGVMSARSAQRALRRARVGVEVASFGVSASSSKVRALASVGAELSSDLEEALLQSGVMIAD